MTTKKVEWRLSDNELRWDYIGELPIHVYVEVNYDYRKGKWQPVIYWLGKKYFNKRWTTLTTAKRNAMKMLAFLENHEEWKRTQAQQ